MENEFRRLVEKGETIRMKIEDAEMRFNFKLVEKYGKELQVCLNDISVLLKDENKLGT